jgi:hypothetical protein
MCDPNILGDHYLMAHKLFDAEAARHQLRPSERSELARVQEIGDRKREGQPETGIQKAPAFEVNQYRRV